MPKKRDLHAFTHKKYEESVNWVTLRFHDPQLEIKYQARRTGPLVLTLSFKISTAILLIILAARRIELLIMGLAEVTSIAENVNLEYLQTGLLVVALLIEVVCYCVKGLNILRGFAVIVFIFFTTCYSSTYYLPDLYLSSK
jgi:hypothetical protein